MMAGGEVVEESGVRVGRDVLGDFDKQQVHRESVPGEQDERGAFAFFGADGAEDIGLALQLRFDVSALCLGLMGSSP